jgi:predicted nucleotidyltransferase
VNPRSSPQRVGPRHPANQIANLGGDRWSTTFVPALPGPVVLEALRATADLDLFVDDEAANIERLTEALTSFGYDITDANPEDFRRYKILLRQYDLPLDIHPFVEGAASCSECWDRRVVADVGGVEASFASLDDLIAMKRAADRPKDREDLRQLERLRQLRDQPPE